VFERKRQNSEVNKNSIFLRIASGGSDSINKAQALLADNGIPKANSRLDMALKLSKLASKHGDEMLPSLILMHPDKPLFDSYYEALIEKKVSEAVNEEKKNSEAALRKKEEEIERLMRSGRYSQDCGCGGSSNDNGPTPATSHRQDNFNTFALAGTLICVSALTLIAINKTK
jgi:hypothetical protein